MRAEPERVPIARLSSATLAQLPVEVDTPRYARAAMTERIVHLGIGAFHRAHQADYLDRLMALEGPRWGIHGVSLRSRDVGAQLGPQDGLYTLATLSDADDRLRVVGAVGSVSFAPDDPPGLVSRMAGPDVTLITTTVTEKGYCHRPADGRLDSSHPDIVHDLANPDRPRSAIGLLAAGLARRHGAGVQAPTILCCDNLPSNGRVLRGLVLEFAAQVFPRALGWLESEVGFPCSMVDRIVPATTAADRATAASRLGLNDEGLVKAEPFSQWVIEDCFVSERPRLEQVGVQYVADVAPFELAKLRLLNGAHSTLAYLGQLAGHAHVADAMADPALLALVTRLMDHEVAPTLPRAAGLDPLDYGRRLRERFRNRALAHRTAQIAMDGSQKLPQRLLGTAADRLAAGASIDALALAVAAWMRYVGGEGENGARFVVDDPLAARLAAASDSAEEVAGKVGALLAIREVFPEALAAHPVWRKALIGAYGMLMTHGARGAAAAAATLEARS
jgi:fructuronate reductase